MTRLPTCSVSSRQGAECLPSFLLPTVVSITDSLPRQEWGVTRLTFEYDSEPFGKERDAAIMKMAKEAGVEVVTENSHTLYDLDK